LPGGDVEGFDANNLLARTAVGAIASKLAGGRAEQAALLAAMEYLYNNAGGVFDTLPNIGNFAPYSPEGRGIADLKYDPRPHGGAVYNKSPAPADHEKMFHERGVRVKDQVFARVGKDTVYKYNFGADGRPHFSAEATVDEVRKFSKGNNRALTTSEKTVEMQRLRQLTQPARPGADWRTMPPEALGRRGGRN
jgi:hypothetical protein